MTIDSRLMSLMVCPLCKGPLTPVHTNNAVSALACPADHLAFPVRDAMPVMLASEATAYEAGTSTPGVGAPHAPFPNV
jgi:uncharacterized protein